MNNTDANRMSPGYELKDDLARLCLPMANRDANLKLAWVNSVCILFLLIGIVGARRGIISIKPVAPIREIVPVVVESMTLPPQAAIQKNEQPEEKNQPRIVVAIPNAPNVSFSVPTIGTLVAPAALASAPPLEPLRAKTQIGSLGSTGAGGERPEPDYPVFFRQMGAQGTIAVLIHGDAAGNVVSVDVKESTGFPALDHYTMNFIKAHWHLPTNAGTLLFQTRITYKLQLNF
jgi:TonB family protein